MTSLYSASSLTLDQDVGTGQADVTKKDMDAFPTMAAGSTLTDGPMSSLLRPYQTITTSIIFVTTPDVKIPFIWRP